MRIPDSVGVSIICTFCHLLAKASVPACTRLAIIEGANLRSTHTVHMCACRSNQKQPPLYKIVSSNISGERRFASAVAYRLEQLGALTQGDRRAASATDALSAYNLQNK